MTTNIKNKQLLLHELLKEDQDPFQLTTYISDRRSHFTKPNTSTKIQLKKRRPITSNTTLKRTNLCRHACFLSFANSSDVTKSPFPDFHTPATMSPYNKKSPNNAVYVHLAEAAMRIQKHSKPGKSVGFGLFGSFLKRLKERSCSNKSKKRGIGNDDLVSKKKCLEVNQASTSSCCSEEMNCDFELWETRFCMSPFKFSVHQSPLSNGKRTPDFCSPIGSPCRVVNQCEENAEIQDSDSVQAGEEENKKQCSPVSVLDPPFEDDEQESGDVTEESYDLEYGYENVQRAKEQLLYRLRRFEKLAALDPIELERKLLEGSDSESQCEFQETDNDEQLLLYTNHAIDSNITKERNEVICLGNKEVVLGRICKRLDFSKEVKFDTIDMMIELDLKSEFEGWKKFSEQREATMADIEFAIFGLLVEELSEDDPSCLN